MNTALWIMVALFGLYVVILTIVTRGKGFKQSWQLLKTDTVARLIMLLTLVVVIFQGSLVLFAFLPWRGIIQWVCGLIVIVLLCCWIGRGSSFKRRSKLI
ncbi:MAG: hypothetical protein H0W02_04855 [Ktedonobacteraceae bacterium]|nr:hypothetical protein [Ktedonobacteraceae bacterium]